MGFVSLAMTMSVAIVINMVRQEKNMQTIQASEFKATCLALMDTVATTGETWVITKNGRPVAELRPYSGGRIDSPFGLHPELEIRGDVMRDLWKVLA